ncbi:hypothetical protein WA1_18460 [Scytonema hofmannii PCC 7110]|uniref:Uncharacterized protein n=1 Tax=Scytonema hofmannii PCC 7110 TaxID=128403 RepID=A0A139XD09_9CYAN|nr:hypothetical protein [Scytonema hofmannii]KYC42577.1 hypothetical protein WA1_18460 [Scytonema hofmannii PCC 7110]
MVDRINDIAWQAHQGSVAAIIQVLNEKLAHSGVRTRAIFDAGVLQLLCEARTVDNLEQRTLVEQVQQILDSIAPRNIYRVNINSRIAREQQLLWLEEISRDSENQLLWSQEIKLVQPNIFEQLVKDFKERKREQGKAVLPTSQSSRLVVVNNKNKFKNSPAKRFLGGASCAVFLLSLSWAGYTLFGNKSKNTYQAETLNSIVPAIRNQSNFPSQPTNSSPSATTLSEDPFSAAVRIANQASATGRSAQTSVQWLDLAARWQRASELMKSVPPNHSRYEEAQIRTQLYKKYSEAAEKESKKKPS